MLKSIWLGVALVLAGIANAQDKALQTKKLATGLEIVSYESHKVPLVTIVLASKAGAMTETADINGLTHLWEHMFFKGNARLPDQEAFNKRIRELGITYNGDTSAEKVRYYFTLPAKFLDEGLEFMRDAIATPLLDQAELERERRVVLDEYDRNAAQPAFDFYNLDRAIIYGKESHRRDPLGVRSIIETATRDQLLRIKDEVFVPSNSAILVSGDFEPAKLNAAITKYFGGWKDPKDWKPVTKPTWPAFPKTTTYVMTRDNVPTAYVAYAFAGPKARSNPKPSYVADVLSGLVDHKGGKFFKKFVDSGKAYSAGFAYSTQSEAAELNLFAEVDAKKVKDVEAALINEVNLWAKPGYFTAVELADIKRKVRISKKRDANQASEYIKNLAFWWAITGIDYYTGYLAEVDKVTLKDVQDFVKTWLVGKSYVGGVLLSPDGAKEAGLADTSKSYIKQYLGR